jgi:hypothetical protein
MSTATHPIEGAPPEDRRPEATIEHLWPQDRAVAELSELAEQGRLGLGEFEPTAKGDLAIYKRQDPDTGRWKVYVLGSDQVPRRGEACLFAPDDGIEPIRGNDTDVIRVRPLTESYAATGIFGMMARRADRFESDQAAAGHNGEVLKIRPRQTVRRSGQHEGRAEWEALAKVGGAWAVLHVERRGPTMYPGLECLVALERGDRTTKPFPLHEARKQYRVFANATEAPNRYVVRLVPPYLTEQPPQTKKLISLLEQAGEALPEPAVGESSARLAS